MKKIITMCVGLSLLCSIPLSCFAGQGQSRNTKDPKKAGQTLNYQSIPDFNI